MAGRAGLLASLPPHLRLIARVGPKPDSSRRTRTEIVLPHTFQIRVREWLTACFGRNVALDRDERLHRFLEEALELAQAGGCNKNDAVQLVNYVFSRPPGGLVDEVGGVMVTLAGLCEASGVDLEDAGESELARNWSRTEEIRAKRARKRPDSPLPQ